MADDAAASVRLAALQRHGVAVQQLDRCEPDALLLELASCGCNRVLWECGPSLAAAALQQGCVQELAVVIAPKLMGGALARTPLGDLGFTAMDQVVPVSLAAAQTLGRDLLLQGLVGAGPIQDGVIRGTRQ